MSVCVVGADSVALVLAVQYAQRGLPTVVTGSRPPLVQAARRGDGCAEEPDLAPRLAACRGEGSVTFEEDPAVAVAGRAIVVLLEAIALRADGQPDLEPLRTVVRRLAPGLEAGSLVMVETIVPVGTTRDVVTPLLAEGSGLSPGDTLLVAHSPQRLAAGHAFADIPRYLKFAGGIDTPSTRRAVEFYLHVMDTTVAPLRNCETSELVKLLETAARGVNQALANEAASLAQRHGVDAKDLVTFGNTQGGFPLLEAGIGPLPDEVHLASALLATDLRLARTAEQVQEAVIREAVAGLAEALENPDAAHVVVLSSFAAPGPDDPAPRSLHRLLQALRSRFQKVRLVSCGDPEALAPPPDALVVADAEVRFFDLPEPVHRHCRALLDCENALRPERVEALGVRYLGIGRVA